MHRYVKIKMFGNFGLDRRNVSALENFWVQIPLFWAINRGYKNIKDLDELSEMIALHKVGMDGVKIPLISARGLIYLQTM